MLDNYKKGTEEERSTEMTDGTAGMGSGWFFIFFLFFLLAWGGNGFGFGGFGNNAAQAALTRAELYEGFNNQEVVRKLDGLANGLCDGFYAQNTTMLQGFNGLGHQIAENRFAAQNCCCETNRNIDAVRYENSRNTCEITTNATYNTQRILDKLCSMESNAKDQRIADLTANLQTANFQLSQQAQSASLINTLRPCPIPAYPACSPYQASNPYSWGYGCGCCNNG